jgi:hypothetical protein
MCPRLRRWAITGASAACRFRVAGGVEDVDTAQRFGAMLCSSDHARDGAVLTQPRRIPSLMHRHVLAIRAAMGWTNSHLYEFRIGGAGWGEPDPDGIYDGPMDAKIGLLVNRHSLTQGRHPCSGH